MLRGDLQGLVLCIGSVALRERRTRGPGGVESLITCPVWQAHGDIPVEIGDKIGVTDDLLRLSVGIERVDDLIQDLEQALAAEEAGI